MGIYFPHFWAVENNNNCNKYYIIFNNQTLSFCFTKWNRSSVPLILVKNPSSTSKPVCPTKNSNLKSNLKSRHVITTWGYFLCVNASPWQSQWLGKVLTKAVCTTITYICSGSHKCFGILFGANSNKKGLFYSQKIILNATKKLHTLCSTVVSWFNEVFRFKQDFTLPENKE